MVLVNRHKLHRRVYVGGMVNPAIQIMSQAGAAVLPHIAKTHLKKLLGGVISGLVATLLAKGLDKGRNYMAKTMTGKLNAGTTSAVLQKLMGISLPNVMGTDPTGLKPIDREMLPIKNQLMAQTADINLTEAPIREVSKGFENLGVSTKVAGYGMKKPRKHVKRGGMIENPHVANALNKRADILLRNIIS